MTSSVSKKELPDRPFEPEALKALRRLQVCALKSLEERIILFEMEVKLVALKCEMGSYVTADRTQFGIEPVATGEAVESSNEDGRCKCGAPWHVERSPRQF